MAMNALRVRSLLPGCYWFLIVLYLSSSGEIARATDVVYLNRCAAGCTIQPGLDDAINHVSSIPSSNRSLAAFPYGDAAFVATASCLRQAYSRYDVSVTTVDPGLAPRREIMLARIPQELGLPAGIEAIAPIYPQPRDNEIVFVFAEQVNGDVDKMCWLAA